MFQDIESLTHLDFCHSFCGNARDTVSDYEATYECYAKVKLAEAVSANTDVFESDCRDRDAFLKQVGHDRSAAALNDVSAKCRMPRRKNGRRTVRKGGCAGTMTVVMERQEAAPRYDAWVPVRTNFWVGKNLLVEPYMPTLGDDDRNAKMSYDVYEDMADDVGFKSPPSDGEVEQGELQWPKTEAGLLSYYSLPETRRRAGCRNAILTVLDTYGKDNDVVWESLSAGVGIKDKERLKLVAKIAEERRTEENATVARREKQRQLVLEVSQEIAVPSTDYKLSGYSNKNACTAVLRNFCFTCLIFACPQHDGVHIEPILPIKDPVAEQRQQQFHTKTADPCSEKCFLVSITEETSSQTSGDSGVWSSEEVLVLREAVPMFKRDPCSLAIVVGTRTCREVDAKLSEPAEAKRMRKAIQRVGQRRRVDTRKAKAVPVRKSSSVWKGCSKSSIDTDDGDSIRDQDFVPCSHDGVCSPAVCSCVQKRLLCESTCGCNFGRFVEGKYKRGIAWAPPSAVDLGRGVARTCPNRHVGCSCRPGNCDSDDCSCWVQNRACNPDFCNDCDCSILPPFAPLSQGGCRNVAVSVAKHKRTMMGESSVHGFGLFAGEQFEAGDLVGVYGGQLLDTRIANATGRLYSAKGLTYFFDCSDSIVIDAG